jgi:hypothetical protein
MRDRLNEAAALLKIAQRKYCELKTALIEKEVVQTRIFNRHGRALFWRFGPRCSPFNGRARTELQLTAAQAEILKRIVRDALKTASMGDIPPPIDVT